MHVFNLIMIPILLFIGLNGVRQAVTYRYISRGMRGCLVGLSIFCFALIPVNLWFGLYGP